MGGRAVTSVASTMTDEASAPATPTRPEISLTPAASPEETGKTSSPQNVQQQKTTQPAADAKFEPSTAQARWRKAAITTVAAGRIGGGMSVFAASIAKIAAEKRESGVYAAAAAPPGTVPEKEVVVEHVSDGSGPKPRRSSHVDFLPSPAKTRVIELESLLKERDAKVTEVTAELSRLQEELQKAMMTQRVATRQGGSRAIRRTFGYLGTNSSST